MLEEVYSEVFIQELEEAICFFSFFFFSGGNQCQSESMADKELNLSPGKVGLSPLTPEMLTVKSL